MKKILFFLFLLIGCGWIFARTIKKGDVIEIAVQGNQALSRTVIVRDDGTVDYPLLVDRSIEDMGVQELMDILTLAVAKADPNNMVVVNLLSDYQLKINVLGQVKKPGLLMIDKGACLQEVLLKAGGPTEFADLKNIKLIRKEDKSEDNEIIDLELFLAEGNLSKLPEVKNEDTYIVLKVKASKNVKVLGAVNRPGFYQTYPDANIFDMIQVAGGQQERADLTKIRHITIIDGKRLDTVVDLRRFWEELGDTENIPKVQEGDMIIVYKKTITWSIFMNYIRDAVALFTVYLLFQTYTNN
jgi:protein involved in polysaccharide export with SLBB domain